jgi:hypothetical protein
MKILQERRVCDGLDVEVLTDQDEVVVWHFAGKKLPIDEHGTELTTEEVCQEIQDRVTAAAKKQDSELEVKKVQLEREVARNEATLATTKTQLAKVKADIAAQAVQAPPNEEPLEDPG